MGEGTGFETVLRAAFEALGESDWDTAAERFIAAANLAEAAGVLEPCRQCLAQAAEAFRRADRPADVVRTHELLRRHSGPAEEVQVANVRLAGALIELGELGAADTLAAAIDHPSCVAMARDLRTSLAMMRDDEGPIEARLADLTAVASTGMARMAVELRTAQWERLQGRLGPAADRLHALRNALVDEPVALAPVESELAEIAALRGDLQTAVDHHVAAVAAHEAAGRSALAWRSEAGRVRALLRAGTTPMGHRLADARQWAIERGMQLLTLDLELVLGWADQNRGLLRQARDRAASLGLPRRRARANLALSELSAPADAMTLAQEASVWAEVDRPLGLQLETARVLALAAMAPAAGERAAAVLTPQVRAMGLMPEADRLADVSAPAR